MKRPISLIMIAVVFLLLGSFLAWNLLATVITQHFLPLFDLSGLLLLLVGNGLLRLQRKWRICALALNILFAIGLIIIVVSKIIPNRMVIFIDTHDLMAQDYSAFFAVIIAVY